MKYYVEYYRVAPEDTRYDVYFKRHWWSRREVVAKEVISFGEGLLGVKNKFIIPHLMKMCKMDFTNRNDPCYNKTDLDL